MINPRDSGQSLPAVAISIDFEMRWGVHDVYGTNFDGYRGALENCRPAVRGMLSMLAERGLSATWATVGALGLQNWEEYFAWAPPPPNYSNPALVVRKEYADMDPEGRLHFAPDLIRAILATPHQELGSHSFSHLYFREHGVTGQDFLADMAAVERLWKTRYRVTPVSLVFPRNQSAFVELLEKTSIRIWRGPEPKWFYNCTTQQANTRLPRALRLADSIMPWVRRAAPLNDGMTRASIFVRFALPEPLWRLQLKRIQDELMDLQPGRVLHLWWHPHNIGFNLIRGVARLRDVLDLVAEERTAGRIASRTMASCYHLTNERC